MRFVRNLLATGMAAATMTVALQAQPVIDAEGDMGIGTLAPDATSILDLTATDKGFLAPRLTTVQRDAMTPLPPADGLLIYNTDLQLFEYWSGVLMAWLPVGAVSGPYWLLVGNLGLTEYAGGPAGSNNYVGTNDFTDFSLVTIEAQNIDFWTNSTQRAIITAGGDVGIAELAPSARLDVVGDNVQPAIEASNTGEYVIHAIRDGGSGSIPSTNPAIYADNGNGAGLAGIGSGGAFNGPGVYGSTNGNGTGVWGQGIGNNFAGVFGRNDAVGGVGVRGTAASGTAGEFNTAGGAANVVEINDGSSGDALEINSNGAGFGIDLNGGALDGDDQGNALGDGSANQQLTVRGAADAVIGNTLLGNPTVWDLVVQGDAVTTGIIKAGGSIWIDGVTPGNHQMVADDQLNVGTLGTDDLTVSTNGANAIIVDGTTQDVNILNDLDVDGDANVDGVLTGNSAGNVLGDNTNATQLTIDGDGGGAFPYELVVDGDAQIAGALGLPGLTPGSVTFIDAAMNLNEDNANFFWNQGLARLGVGTNAPTAKVHALSSTPEPAGRFEYNFIAGTALEVVGTGLGGLGASISTNYLAGTALNVVHSTAAGGDAVVVNEVGGGTGLTINSDAAGLGIDLNNGALDGDAAANALGDGSANQQLTVRGTPDAVIGNTLAGNPTVWDQVIAGDVVATGIAKIGGSIWVDGVTPGNHQMVADDQLNVGTLGTDDLTVSTNGANAIIVDGTTQDVNILNDLDVDGDLNVDGLTTLDGTTVDGPFTNNIGPADFNGDLDVDGVTTLDATTVDGPFTNNVGPATLNGPTSVNNNLVVTGTSDLQNSISNSSGNNSGQVHIADDMQVVGVADFNAPIINSVGNLLVADNVDLLGNIVPLIPNAFSLGSDADRFADIWVSGASVHIGTGLATEMNLGYAGNVGTINVDGGNPEITIDRTVSNAIRFDPNGNGGFEAIIHTTGLNVSASPGPEPGGDLTLSRGGIRRLGAGPQSLEFATTGGGALNLDLPNGGSITASGAGNSFGANAAGTQLTVDGDGLDNVGNGYEFVVEGDANIVGTLTVGNFGFTGDLDMNSNDIFDVGQIRFNDGGDNLLNTAGDVQVGDDFRVTGATDLDGTLNVDGAVVFQSVFTVMGNTILDANTTVNGNSEFNGTAQFDGTSTFNANSIWNGGNNVTLNNGTLTANKTAAGSAVAINNTNGTTAIAINVAAGGGRTILSYAGGAGAIPTDVSVFGATGNVTLPTSTENGQILHVANTTGGAITVNGGAFTNIPAGEMRDYIYAAGAWYEQL